MPLEQKTCKACISATRPLETNEYQTLLTELQNWSVINNHHLSKSFRTSNFIEAMDLANKVARLAETEGHHPDLLIRWGELKIDTWTHKVDGLTESDFILAAKIDKLLA